MARIAGVTLPDARPISIGRDFIQLDTNSYLWLSSQTGTSNVEFVSGDPAKYAAKTLIPTTVTTAGDILGLQS